MSATDQTETSTDIDAPPWAAELLASVKALQTDSELLVRGVGAIARQPGAVGPLEARVRQLESELAGRHLLPILVPVHRALNVMRRAELDTEDHFAGVSAELETALHAAGCAELWPQIGDVFDAEVHEPLLTSTGSATVDEVYASGLTMGNLVLIRAQVKVV